jgi:hypothetical protein
MCIFEPNWATTFALVTTARHNWSWEEDEDVFTKLPVVFLLPEDPHIEPPPSPKSGEATLLSWAATAVCRVICYPRWAPPWPPLCFAISPIAFGAPECLGCSAPRSRPLGYSAAGFPLSHRRRTCRGRPPPPFVGSTARIRTRGYPFTFSIMAKDLRTGISHLTRVRGLMHQPPWTYSTRFSVENIIQ